MWQSSMACTGRQIAVAFITAALYLAYIKVPPSVTTSFSSMTHTVASNLTDDIKPVLPPVSRRLSVSSSAAPFYSLPKWCKRNMYTKTKCWYIRAHGDALGDQLDEIVFGAALAKSCEKRFCAILLDKRSYNGDNLRKGTMKIFGRNCAPGVITELPKNAHVCNATGYCFSEGCDIPDESDSVSIMMNMAGHGDFNSHVTKEFMQELQTVVYPQLTPYQTLFYDPRKSVAFDLRKYRAESFPERYTKDYVNRYKLLIDALGRFMPDGDIHVWADDFTVASTLQDLAGHVRIQSHVGERDLLKAWAHLTAARVLVTGVTFMKVGKYVPAMLNAGCVIYDKIEGRTIGRWMDLLTFPSKLERCLRATENL